MFFKNLSVYRMPSHWRMTAEQIETALSNHTFTAPLASQALSHGWVPPLDGGTPLVHTVNGQHLMALRTEKKLLPSSVVNRKAKARAIEIEDRQGFRPGRKQMKEIREVIFDELLPKALTTVADTFVWIDPMNGWLIVNTPSKCRSDEVVKWLIKSFEKLPLEMLCLARSPLSIMTEWLSTDEAPANFTIDQDAELRSPGEGHATVRYSNATLDAQDVRTHLAQGKQCTKLALTWNDRISLVVQEDFSIKRVKPLDVLTESLDIGSKDAQERFDSDFALMTGELNGLLSALVEAFGGEKPRTPEADLF